MNETNLEICQSSQIKNRILCKGICLIFNVKDGLLVLLVFSLFLFVFFFFTFGVGRFLWMEESPGFLIGVWVVMILTLINYLRCSMKDPGVVITCDPNIPEELKFKESESNTDQIPKNEELDKSKENSQTEIKISKEDRFNLYRYCSTCKIYRPPKSSHCSHCGFCVKNFDHHCFFVGNCIGARNYANFVYFLAFSTLTSFLILVFSIIFMIKISDEIVTNTVFYWSLGLFCSTFGVSFCPLYGPVKLMLMTIVGITAGIVDLVYIGMYDSRTGVTLLQIFVSFPFFLWTLIFTCGNCSQILEGKTLKERHILHKEKPQNPQNFKNFMKFLKRSYPQSEIRYLISN